MTVAHLVPALFGKDGTIGGAERYVLELARHMARRVPTSLVTFGERESETSQGELTVKVVRTARNVRGQKANPIAWAAVKEASAADIVHCHQQHVLATSMTALLSRVRRHKVFCTELGGGGWDISAYLSTDRWFDGHLHISEYSRRVSGHGGLASARVIYGGVDTERFSPAPDVPRDIDCLFVGRLLPHKGVDVLVAALPADINAVVAGPTPDARYLADLRTLAQAKRVHFIHDADDDALAGLYRRARIVVLPSVYRDRYGGETRVPELLGQTLLEGMAAGAATICSDVASMPEIVVDGVTGKVVPPNDPDALRAAISGLLAHPGEAAAMGEAGRKRVLAHFTWPQVVDRCLQAYAS